MIDAFKFCQYLASFRFHSTLSFKTCKTWFPMSASALCFPIAVDTGGSCSSLPAVLHQAHLIVFFSRLQKSRKRTDWIMLMISSIDKNTIVDEIMTIFIGICLVIHESCFNTISIGELVTVLSFCYINFQQCFRIIISGWRQCQLNNCLKLYFIELQLD